MEIALLPVLLALLGLLSLVTLRIGLWPLENDSKKWYDRAASVTVGAALLLGLVWFFFFYSLE